MAENPVPSNDEQTKHNIAMVATIDAGTSKEDIVQKGASVHAIADKELRELITANPNAARGAIAELQSSASTERDPDVKKAAIDAANTIKEDLQQAVKLTPEARTQQAIANVEQDAAAWVASSKASTDGVAVSMEAGRLTALVSANPEAAQLAVKDLEGKNGRNLPIATQEAIATIKAAMQEAGINGGKDVQPHDVRHDTAAIAGARTNQLGG